METLLLVSVILLFAVFILHIVGVAKDGGEIDRWEHIVASLLTTFVILGLAIATVIIRGTPTAMDVYESKTEMMYNVTIRGNDTIVDSTVVLKEDK